MHGPALAAGAAGGLAVQLGEHGAQAAALRQVERVPAVGAEDDVLRPQRGADADGDRLLADGEVDRALDLVTRVSPGDLLFHPADAVERAVQRGVHPGCLPWV